MFRFESPDLLFALIAIPILLFAFFASDRLRKQRLLSFGTEELVKKLTGGVSIGRRWTKRTLILTAVLLLVIAWANPQIGTKLEEIKREGIDVLVAIDVSYSMMAEDIAPNRLKKAKFEVQQLINRLEGDRVGLIPFAGVAFTQCPLTLDYTTAIRFLDLINEYTIPQQGTSLSAAIETAVRSFPTKDRKYKVLIVITDGEDHEAEVEAAARLAKEKGVVIYTIGIGSTQGVPIPVYNRYGNRIGFKKDRSGNIVTTRLNAETLKQVASISGGKFFHVTPDNPELDAIINEIATMEKKELGAKQFTTFEDRFQIFLIVAVLLFIIEFLLPERVRVAQEWKGRFQ